MLICACAKRLELNHKNKIREILCNGPSAKIYTLEIYPLYGTNEVKGLSKEHIDI